MEHHFNVEAAKIVGVNAATILNHMIWWCQKNSASGTNVHDGRAWTYNTAASLSEIFPYLTENQVRTAIKKLIDSGLLMKGDYSANRYARPNYYAPTDRALEICDATMPDLSESEAGKNRSRQTKKPVSNICTVKDTVTETDICPVPSERGQDGSNQELRESACRVIDHLNRVTGKSYRHSKTATSPIIARLKDGYSEDTLMQIVDTMSAKWMGDAKMEQYIQPSTLFRPTNCENYEQLTIKKKAPKFMTFGEYFG